MDIHLHLRKTDPAVSLVTVGGREFYVYRYEGKLNGISNAAVIFSYPKGLFVMTIMVGIMLMLCSCGKSESVAK